MSREFTLMDAQQAGGDAASLAAAEVAYEVARADFDAVYADAQAGGAPMQYAAALEARRELERARTRVLELVRRAESVRYSAEGR